MIVYFQEELGGWGDKEGSVTEILGGGRYTVVSHYNCQKTTILFVPRDAIVMWTQEGQDRINAGNMWATVLAVVLTSVIVMCFCVCMCCVGILVAFRKETLEWLRAMRNQEFKGSARRPRHPSRL